MDVALTTVPDTGARALPPVIVIGDRTMREALAAGLCDAGIDAIAGEVATADRGVIVCAPSGDGTTVRSAFHAARDARLDEKGAFVVVTRLGGDFGVHGCDHPVLAGLFGLAKTVALEHPTAFVRALDTTADQCIPSLVAELGRAGPVEIGLTGSVRRTLSAVMLPSPHAAAIALGPDDVIVVSGGARGVTAACVIELASRFQARFVLLGRSRIDVAEPPEAGSAATEPLLMRALAKPGMSPPDLRRQVGSILAAREARTTLAAVEATGGRAIYVPVDVCDEAAVGAALDRVRADWGAITGLVHGAGVIHDRRVKEKTDAQWDAVWATKIAGMQALLRATKQDPLKVLCLFSSVAARTGNIGQADYAAANEVLNRTAAAEQRHRPASVVKSIGWGPWEGGMVTPALAKAFHGRGIALIPLLAGARAFADELVNGGPRGPTEVVIGGLLAGDTQAPSLRRACARDYAFLKDHTVADAPVVPVVLALEWFAQRARELRPSQFVHAVERVGVLKGITLQDYDGAGDLFAIHTTAERAEGYSFELRSLAGTLHYRADVRLGATPPTAPSAPPVGPTRGYAHDADAIYARLLFHGPDFQVIRRVVDVAEDRAEAELAHDKEWANNTWITDMASGDGGLQLAVLWSRSAVGGASLPTGIAAMRPYGVPAPGPVRSVLTGHKREGKRTVSDVALVDAKGRVYADFLGVELHALPAGEYPGKSG